MLSKLSSFPGITGPVVTIVLDGFGLGKSDVGNAIMSGRTPVLDRLFQNYSHVPLKAHGVAVGLPSDDDMGNSEVGHNAIGAGQVYNQGAALVNDAIKTGNMYEGQTWKDLSENCRTHSSTMHFIGLFSDGNVQLCNFGICHAHLRSYFES